MSRGTMEHAERERHSSPEKDGAKEVRAKKGDRNRILAVVGVMAALGIAAGTYMWIRSGRSASTDDAFIDGRILQINSKVAGQAVAVFVDDNQEVKKGDPLATIDPVDYRIKRDQARAELEAARAEARRSAAEEERARKLFDKEEVSRQVYDNASAAADVARAKADLADKKLAAADLDLANTQIVAPEAGRIARKSVELKSFVQVGQPLMALVTRDLWVTANFKETQLTQMKPGQKALIKIDAFPGREFHGHVDSVQPGTGSRFSLFPPENATGNFVKVVQRVPVKIVFDDPPESMPPLAAGMSVVPTVDLR